MVKAILKMSVLMALVCVVCTTAQAGVEVSIKDDFDNFVKGGCQTSKLVTQIETRILKNVPFALGGYKFKSPDLAFLYTSDGWYKGVTDTMPKLSSTYQSCVNKLAKREKELNQKYKIDPEIKSVISRSVSVYFALRTKLHDYPAKFATDTPGNKTATTWSWFLVDKSSCGGSGNPEEAHECSGFAIMCEMPKDSKDWSKLSCYFSWAG